MAGGIISIFITHPHHTFLTILFFLTAYGIGINSIQIFPLCLLSALKIYVDRGIARRDRSTLFAIPVLALGTAYAFYDPNSSSVNPLESTTALILLASIFSTVAVSTIVVAVLVARNLPTSQFTWASFFVFPAVWSLGWMAVGRNSPLGRWGDWTQETGGVIDPFLQITAYFGLPGVDFVMALLAEVIAVWAERLMMEDKDVELFHGIQPHGIQPHDYGAAPIEDGAEHAEEPLIPSRGKHFLPFGHAPFYSTLFIVAVVFVGSARLTAVQQPSDKQKVQVTEMACILRPLTNSSDKTQDPVEDMLAETVRYSTQAKLLLWSESAITINKYSELEAVLDRAKNISIKAKTYLGITYLAPAQDNPRRYKNVLTMIDPKGDILFNYEKTHPVPFAESLSVEPGPGLLPLESISFPMPHRKGRPFPKLDPITVSAAICLDMDFPALISQASSAHLVVSPAQTWSPAIGRVHFNMARVRAIEHGFAVLRCDSGGVSGFIDEFGRVKNYQEADSVSGTSRSFVINWSPGPKVNTWYSVIGDWGAAGVIVGLVGLAWAVDRGMERVHSAEGEV